MPGRAPRSYVVGGKAGVVADLAAGTILVAAGAAATWWLLGLPARQMFVPLALYLAMAGLLVARIPSDAPGPGLGPANRVTLARAALFMPVAALALASAPLGTVGEWWVIGLGTAIMIMDGLDGRVARRTRTETQFGARFDMELDAALLLALSMLVWLDGRAGAWCLSIGLMRYIFVAAGWAWPTLAAPLPESLRRKVVCVVQGVVLLVALGPIVPGWLATTVVAGGLAALVYSFAVDVRWLIAHAPGAVALGAGDGGS